jgi:hypothetical protein
MKAIIASLIVLACLVAFALWRSMGSGAPPARALPRNEPAPAPKQHTQGRVPRTPAIQDEPASSSGVQPYMQGQLPGTRATSPALVLREESIAIEGLRACALFTGRYPESLAAIDGHLSKIIRQLGENPAAEVQSTGLDAGPARTRGERIVSICRLMSFYTFLCGDRREPVYYGKVVKPGEADRILLRWRFTLNDYRVIYGDLHTETVSADWLAHLEATLPR